MTAKTRSSQSRGNFENCTHNIKAETVSPHNIFIMALCSIQKDNQSIWQGYFKVALLFLKRKIAGGGHVFVFVWISIQPFKFHIIFSETTLLLIDCKQVCIIQRDNRSIWRGHLTVTLLFFCREKQQAVVARLFFYGSPIHSTFM